MSRRRQEDSNHIRDRVRDLIGKSDRRIAKRLIFEGFFVPKKDVAPENLEFIESCRRTVNNHRHAILKEWKSEALPKPGDPASAHEFIASCRTRIEDLDEIAERSDTKATAKVNAYGEIRQLLTLIAKVRGVTVDLRASRGEGDEGDENQAKLPFIGLIADLSRVSPEAMKRIKGERKGNERGRRGGAAGVESARRRKAS